MDVVGVSFDLHLPPSESFYLPLHCIIVSLSSPVFAVILTVRPVIRFVTFAAISLPLLA